MPKGSDPRGQPDLLDELIARPVDEELDLLAAVLVQQGAEFLLIKRDPLAIEFEDAVAFVGPNTGSGRSL
jgi:hypothetical protein